MAKIQAITLPLYRPLLQAILFLLLLSSSIPIFGIGLAEYKKNLTATQVDVDELLVQLSMQEQGEGDQKMIAELLANVRKKLPTGQKIDIPGGAVEADSDWLIASLDDFEKRSNLSEKAVLLTGIKERLAAINARIRELEKATEDTRSKDEDKQKLAEILRREEYQKPKVEEESLIERWWREFKDWLANQFPSPNTNPNQTDGFQSLSLVLQILLYALLAAAIGFLIYRFAPLFATRFGGKTKNRKRDRVVLGERIADDASAHDLFAEADDLARNGDLRLAIRKGYIALLCELSDRKIIGLALHKTNRDYLRDVRKRPRLFENMSDMTSSFERHWYGFKQFEREDWEAFRASYQRAVTESHR